MSKDETGKNRVEDGLKGRKMRFFFVFDVILKTIFVILFFICYIQAYLKPMYALYLIIIVPLASDHFLIYVSV